VAGLGLHRRRVLRDADVAIRGASANAANSRRGRHPTGYAGVVRSGLLPVAHRMRPQNVTRSAVPRHHLRLRRSDVPCARGQAAEAARTHPSRTRRNDRREVHQNIRRHTAGVPVDAIDVRRSVGVRSPSQTSLTCAQSLRFGSAFQQWP